MWWQQQGFSQVSQQVGLAQQPQAFSQQAGLAQQAGAAQAFAQQAGFAQHVGSGAQAFTSPQPQLSQRWQTNRPFRPLNRSHRLQQVSQQGFSQQAGLAQQVGAAQVFAQQVGFAQQPQVFSQQAGLAQQAGAAQAFAQQVGLAQQAQAFSQQAGFAQQAGSGEQHFADAQAAGPQVLQSPLFRPNRRSIRSPASPWLTRAALTRSAPKKILPFIEQPLLYNERGPFVFLPGGRNRGARRRGRNAKMQLRQPARVLPWARTDTDVVRVQLPGRWVQSQFSRCIAPGPSSHSLTRFIPIRLPDAPLSMPTSARESR